MLIRHDRETDTKYVTLLPEKSKKGVVARTEKVYPWLLVDYDANSQIYGIEILDASQHAGPLVITGNQIFFPEVVSYVQTQFTDGSEAVYGLGEKNKITLSLDSFPFV